MGGVKKVLFAISSIVESIMMKVLCLTGILLVGMLTGPAGCNGTSGGSNVFTIDGKVLPPVDPKPLDWHWSTTVLVDGGKKTAFIKEDNSFSVQGLAPGSYLVEVSSPTFTYEPCRVDITNKGKVRARRVNNVQPSEVIAVPYPIKFKALGRTNYFAKREEWRASDVLFNPMIWMMIMPLFVVSVLPKILSDPETKKELDQVRQSMNVQQN